MTHTIKLLTAILMSSTLLVACGGGSSGSTSTTGGTNGSITFSGSGAADVLSGTTYSPSTGTISSGAHPVLPATTFYSVSWSIPGAGAGDETGITYTETIAAGGTSYSLAVTSGVHTPVFSFNNWSGYDGATQLTGVTVDKKAKTIAFNNVTLAGASGTTTTLILDGSLTAK